jgi:hypothetical protein
MMRRKKRQPGGWRIRPALPRLIAAAGCLPSHEQLGAVAGHAHQQARDSSGQSFHFHLLRLHCGVSCGHRYSLYRPVAAVAPIPFSNDRYFSDE